MTGERINSHSIQLRHSNPLRRENRSSDGSDTLTRLDFLNLGVITRRKILTCKMLSTWQSGESRRVRVSEPSWGSFGANTKVRFLTDLVLGRSKLDPVSLSSKFSRSNFSQIVPYSGVGAILTFYLIDTNKIQDIIPTYLAFCEESVKLLQGPTSGGFVACLPKPLSSLQANRPCVLLASLR